MGKAKYTTEPWEIYEKDGVYHINQKNPLSRVGTLAKGKGAKEDAQRIVECVNACKGIVDPSAVPKLLEAVELWMKAWTTPPSEMSEEEKRNIRIRAGELSRKALENATGKKLLR